MALLLEKHTRPAVWEASREYFSALAIYLASRVVIYLAIQFSMDYVPRNPDGGEAFWDAGSFWYDRLLRWDSGWYLSIITHGYHYDGNDAVQQTVNFAPLYPLAAWLVSLIPTLAAPEAMLIVSGVSAVAAVLLFYKLVKNQFGDNVGLTAVAFLSFFPTSFFLSAGYAESLTLLLMVACFLLLERGALLWAAAVAGLALAARPTGIVLLPVLWWAIWQNHRHDVTRMLIYLATVTLLATSGLWLFSIYQWAEFGYPFGFFTNRGAFLDRQVGSGLIDALMLKPFRHLHLGLQPRKAELLFFVTGFACIIAACRRLPFSYTLFGISALLLPYLSYASFYAMPRFALLAFPAFIGAALLCEGRTWLTGCLLALSATLLFWYTALFSQWYWVA
jgi:4-amino-4-deoxy-L-arabinose transferase-like glycosyltransferase